MADMLQGYFKAANQVEAEKFLQEYYKKFVIPLTNADLAGTYDLTISGPRGGTVSVTISPSGSGGTVVFPGSPSNGSYTFVGDVMTIKQYWDPFPIPEGMQYGADKTYTIRMARSGSTITGTGTVHTYYWLEGDPSITYDADVSLQKTG